MIKMKAYVITHVSSFEPRAEAVGKWLQAQGAEVTWISSDFDHLQNRTVVRKKKDHVFLHLKPYSHNLSVKRMQSIHTFAGAVGKYLSGRPIDLLYVLIPANSFAPVAEKLKAETGAAVVLDILDLWPESLPIEALKKLPPMRIWSSLRDRHLGCADLIFTECRLYQQLLELPQERTHTLYWFGKRAGIPKDNKPADSRLHIAYLGSINYIIDLKAIGGLLRVLQERIPVTVEVIGEGETKDELIKTIEKAGAQARYHGAVYDEEKKAEILSGCSFGLNMMVPQVRVGLTMKSLDYMAHGLPLLNSIPGDTWELVEEYDAGVNVPRESPEDAVEYILAMAKDERARDDTKRLFEEKFTEERFDQTLNRWLSPLLAKHKPADTNRANSGLPGTGQADPDRSETASADGNVPSSAENTKRKNMVQSCRKTPEISVAMTVCNGEKYLPAQLDSILQQLGESDEVIASVDPSEDASFAVLCEYAARDGRIRVTEGPGKGVVRNVEHALHQCSGKKIFLADQDDVWLPGKVQKVSRLLEQDALVLHDAKIVDDSLNEMEPSYMVWRRSRKGVIANLWRNSYIGCCMAFRRELLDSILPFPETLPMHDQWIGLMAEKHGTVRLLRTPLLLYRRHEDTATNDRHANMAQMLRWRAEITREVLKR